MTEYSGAFFKIRKWVICMCEYSSTDDEKYMRHAIELAKQGLGWTNPNPMVGAVIVKDGKIIGEGYHKKYGELHAETSALNSCTKSPEGATIYVTLEPCCHHGKQPPCTEAIIKAGIKRVVIGSLDPNPLVSGKGMQILREHNIQVDNKLVCNRECIDMNYVFFHYIKEKLPYVIVKYAQTLDGKIATHNGLSKWITGEAARENVHMDRHRYSAIMVGINTVLKDDPMLNCRSKAIENPHQPVRIVCDTKLRIPYDSKLVKTAGQIPVWIVTCCHDKERINMYENAGCEIIAMEGEKIDIAQLMIILGRRGIDSCICEGGAELNWSVINSGMVKRIQAYIAPKIFGGVDAPVSVAGTGFDAPDDALKLKDYTVTRLGDDILIEGEV